MNCALCSATTNLQDFAIAPREDSLTLCEHCFAGANGAIEDTPHWQCLNDAIWTQDAATQVLAYRLLKALPQAPWARDLLDISYLEPDTLTWANAVDITAADAETEVIHRDSNGAVLEAGDAVVLIKDLPVKGAGFTAKRGTAVRNISLVMDNADQIEGRVEGQRIVILTKFVKKS